jgi:hypothetical protein
MDTRLLQHRRREQQREALALSGHPKILIDCARENQRKSAVKFNFELLVDSNFGNRAYS